jgi:hypothetical protein
MVANDGTDAAPRSRAFALGFARGCRAVLCLQPFFQIFILCLIENKAILERSLRFPILLRSFLKDYQSIIDGKLSLLFTGCYKDLYFSFKRIFCLFTKFVSFKQISFFDFLRTPYYKWINQILFYKLPS